MLKTLEEILNSPNYALPAKNSSSQPFVIFVENLINQYLKEINSSNNLFNELVPNSQLLDLAEFRNTSNLCGEDIIKILRLYNAGNSLDALSMFDKLMKSIGLFLNNQPDAVFIIKKNDFYYRSKSNSNLLDQDRFFHTPYEKSGLISGTRFAPPGQAAMYLSNTLIVGYLEINTTNFSEFQGVKFEPNFPLSFLDIDFHKPKAELKTTKPIDYYTQLQVKGLIYPLLLACYTFQNTLGAPSLQEYIIPQLLLKWVKSKNQLIQGIKYSSTKIIKPPFVGNFYNLVIPPIDIKDEGYCKELKRLFNMSDVCSGQFHKVEFEDYFKTHYNPNIKINPNVDIVEWNTGVSEYQQTDIGKMEFYLEKKFPVSKIVF